ncbi:GAF domain-containing protein [Sphingomonas sp. ST-64]|uniref:GAF domain-containing protein n=1 Tax=Sphingomonas plantiphila TaxID=3163295 RepID=A0ABW8YNU6_9SPHN
MLPIYSADAFRRAALFASGLLALRGSMPLHALLDDVAHQIDVPITGVSVIENGFCWLPVALGLNIERLPISDALCVDTNGFPADLLEPDLLASARYRDHPLVAGPMAIRAFASAPLRGIEGVELGTVFIGDRKARPDFLVRAKATLEHAARHIMAEASAPYHLRRMGHTTLAELEALIRDATRDGDDELVTAIDRVLQTILPHTGIRDV